MKEAYLYHYRAVVLDAYDGDTLTVKLDLGLKMFHITKVRLYGVDTPELRGAERQAGLDARNVVHELVKGREVLVRTHKDRKGKYGRYLAEIIFEHPDLDGPTNLSDYLVAHGHARRVDYG